MRRPKAHDGEVIEVYLILSLLVFVLGYGFGTLFGPELRWTVDRRELRSV